jgi:hypothetical protein
LFCLFVVGVGCLGAISVSACGELQVISGLTKSCWFYT